MIARSLIRDCLQCWRRRKTSSVEQDLDVVTGGYKLWQSPSTPRPGHQPDQEAEHSNAELGPRLLLASSHVPPLRRQTPKRTVDGRKKRTAHPDRRAPIAGSNSDRLKPGLSPPKSQTGLYKLPWSSFLMVASRQGTFDLDGKGDSDEKSWFAEELMDPLEREDLQPKEVETSAPTSYEDIVKARVEENRREEVATRSRARRRALVVAKVTGTSGSSGNRPMIAPISGGVFEGEGLRVVTFDDRESQGMDTRALAGDSDFDGEPRARLYKVIRWSGLLRSCAVPRRCEARPGGIRSLLDADEEDFIENLLLEA